MYPANTDTKIIQIQLATFFLICAYVLFLWFTPEEKINDSVIPASTTQQDIIQYGGIDSRL